MTFNPRLRIRLIAGDLPAWLEKHSRKNYIVSCILASMPWETTATMSELRKSAASLTLQTGIRHVLDHIIPLNHPYVCGLHIAANIQIIPATVNSFKGNKFHPDQLDLFKETSS